MDVVRHRERQLWRYGLAEKEPGRSYVLPRRRAGWTDHGPERTFAWLGQARRLSKDHERLPDTSEAMIYGAMSRLMLRRLAKAGA